jgi:uncharacterized protein YacL
MIKNDNERRINMPDEYRDKNFEETSDNMDSKISRASKYPIVFVVIGALGLTLTGILMLRLYNNTSNVKELMMPLILYFIPFAVSFLLLRFGIQRLSNRKR